MNKQQVGNSDLMASSIKYELPISSNVVRRTTTAWLMLGLASLVGAGLFSLLLVLARTPAIQEWLPFIDFFAWRWSYTSIYLY